MARPPPPQIAADMQNEFAALIKYLNLDQCFADPPPPCKFRVVKGCTLSENGTVATSCTDEAPFKTIVVGDGPGVKTGIHCWSVRMVAGDRFMVGVVPLSEIPALAAEDDYPYYAAGFYLWSHNGKLYCGPPFHYDTREYAAGAGAGGAVYDGILDCDRGTLSFSKDGTELGIAYEGIGMADPLTLCCLLLEADNAVALDKVS